MKHIFLLLTLISALFAGVESQNSTAYQECLKISTTNNIIGTWGQRSMGGSVGTYVSLIILSLQDVNLEGKQIPQGEVSIYDICKKTLQTNQNKNANFILGLNKIIKQENANNKLIVFTTLEELSKYH